MLASKSGRRHLLFGYSQTKCLLLARLDTALAMGAPSTSLICRSGHHTDLSDLFVGQHVFGLWKVHTATDYWHVYGHKLCFLAS